MFCTLIGGSQTVEDACLELGVFDRTVVPLLCYAILLAELSKLEECLGEEENLLLICLALAFVLVSKMAFGKDAFDLRKNQ